jgi:hypothetical protein
MSQSQSTFNLDTFFQAEPCAYEENFWTSHEVFLEIPEFDLEPETKYHQEAFLEEDALSLDSDALLLHSEVQSHSLGKDTGSTKAHTNLAETASLSSTWSQMDLAKPASTKRAQDPSKHFEQVFLKIIDLESVSFLTPNQISNDPSLQRFVSLSIEIISRTKLAKVQNEAPEDFIMRCNQLLQTDANSKRKDQQLRMVFNSLIKWVMKGVGAGKPKAHPANRIPRRSKEQNFYAAYGGNRATELQEALESCKFPSKKKLKSLFSRFPLLTSAITEVINSPSFQGDFQAKRLQKAERVAGMFFLNEESKQLSVSALGEHIRNNMKGLPWSETEMRFSCDLIILALPSCLTMSSVHF